jgi:2-iminobutanoate/2-iminopropanoate deaminase
MTQVQTLLFNSAPKAIGCYCHMAVVGNTGYVSGLLPLCPESMTLKGDTARDQARQVLANLEAILAEYGIDKRAVAKTTILLEDIQYFAEVNEVYAEYFGTHTPARSCFAVKALPLSAKLEIEFVLAV